MSPPSAPAQSLEIVSHGARDRFGTLRWLIAACACAGLLSVVRVPIQLILLLSTLWLGLFLLRKAFRDNAKLARLIGRRRFCWTILKTVFYFVPCALVLLPGFLVGAKVAEWTNRGIEALQSWSGPESVQEEILAPIERQREELVKRDLPWWYAPAVWVGLVDDYATQVVTEIEMVVDTVSRSRPQPVLVVAIAGVGKAVLLGLGVYSITWVVVLFMRSFASVFGRVLVAEDVPIMITVGNGELLQAPLLRAGRMSAPLRFESGPQIELSLGASDTLFVRRSDLPENATPDLLRNWGSGALLARTRAGLLVVDRVVGGEAGLRLGFRAVGSYRYSALLLDEGEEVVVNADRVVGFSDSVRFRVRWDFNLAMLALHQASSLLAKGPGRLILKSDGAPAVHQRAEDAGLINFGNLMLFSNTTQFTIKASKGYSNYIFSECRVSPVSGDLFVVAPGPGNRMTTFQSIWKLVKQVYIPI